MNRAQQALLWAAVVFPGAGHLALGHFRRGAALVGLTLFCLTLMLYRSMQLANRVLEGLAQSGDLPDPTALADLVWHACRADSTLTALLWAVLACWLAGIIDSYRLGKQPAP